MTLESPDAMGRFERLIRGIKTMQTRLDTRDRECMDWLRRHENGSIRDLCKCFSVTTTAIRQRLARLMDQGLITRTAVPPEGRGRPHHVYQITEKGLKDLGNNYGDLARILWNEVKKIDNDTARQQIIAGIRSAMVTHYSAQVGNGSVTEKFTRLAQSMIDGGYDVELDERNGLPILRENNCPYPDLACCDPEICNLEQDVFSEVLGTPLELTTCWRDGETCCEFEPQQGQLQAGTVLLE
ncbi:MAG TPA: transcriptional regulator [Planctomycetaceae bacterium]|nr:transcriptional regulator [Planctomycetaceae bacterium]